MVANHCWTTPPASKSVCTSYLACLRPLTAPPTTFLNASSMRELTINKNSDNAVLCIEGFQSVCFLIFMINCCCSCGTEETSFHDVRCPLPSPFPTADCKLDGCFCTGSKSSVAQRSECCLFKQLYAFLNTTSIIVSYQDRVLQMLLSVFPSPMVFLQACLVQSIDTPFLVPLDLVEVAYH